MVDHSWLRLGAWADFDALRALWERRLPEALEHARRSPFYRDRLAYRDHPGESGQAATCLARLPLTQCR